MISHWKPYFIHMTQTSKAKNKEITQNWSDVHDSALHQFDLSIVLANQDCHQSFQSKDNYTLKYSHWHGFHDGTWKKQKKHQLYYTFYVCLHSNFHSRICSKPAILLLTTLNTFQNEKRAHICWHLWHYFWISKPICSKVLQSTKE